MTRRLLLPLFALCFAQGALAADYAWLEGLRLFALEESGPQAMHRARVAIQEAGGTVGVMSSGGVILGWLAEDSAEQLVGQSGIRSVHAQPVAFDELGIDAAKRPADLPHFVQYFNEVTSGRFVREQNAKPDAPALRVPGGDALAAEPLEWETYLRNLERQGYTREQLLEWGLLDAGKSPDNDSMSGTILASVFIVESDGSGSDPNNHDWSEAEVQEIVNARITGCLWWAGTSAAYGSCWAAFLIEVYLPSDPRLQSPLEPVHSEEVGTVMQQVMNAFGYFGGAYSANSSFNTARRIATGSNRAYSMITTWGSGRAWAYRFGPYTWLPYPTAAPEVTAHETGHIFGACDEYAEACGNCPNPGCTANGVGNPNCETCPNSVACVMISNTYTLCSYTDNHVGWSFSPCSPPQLPSPSLTSITPSSGLAGETITLTISGSNILQAAQLTLGPGVSVYETSYTGGNQIIAQVQINTIATPGLRDAQLVNPDLKQASLPGSFEVVATPAHYYSPGGGNVFPYTSPAHAATTLAAAIGAAGPGDTIYLEAGTLSNVNLLLTRDLNFSGGWDGSFSAQDEIAKTVIDPTPNIRSVANLGFENVRFVDGEGRIEVLPVEGAYGGAIAVHGGDLTLVNCEFESNQALDPNDVGLGGAVYVQGGTVTISGTSFDANSAYQGGALYLKDCAVSISNSSFTGNDIQLGGTVGDEGGAIRAVDCSDFIWVNNSCHGNFGVKRGGAIYLSNVTGIAMQGGQIAGHDVVEQGGALWISSGSGTIEGVHFDDNSAGSSGGALFAQTGSSLVVRDNHFSGNAALLGAAIQVVGGEAFLDHNLFTANQSSATGNAIYVSSLSDGSVIGNVASGSLGSPSSADFLVIASPIEVKNNIVHLSPGVGITCSGSPDVDYNLVFGSAGAPYSGCGPGANARSGDPLFVGGGDFHLGLHSPAIDSGDPGRPDADGTPGDLGLYGAHDLTLQQPLPPGNLSSQPIGPDVELSWDANGEADLAAYAIYADVASGFTPSLANFVALVPAGSESYDLGPVAQTTYVRINAIDQDGYAGGYSAELEIGEATSTEPPQRFRWALHGAIPNPFNPRTRIDFELANSGPVELVVFDVTGRAVRSLLRESRTAGAHSVEWDARDDAGRAVASGIYYYELRAKGFRATEKVVLLK